MIIIIFTLWYIIGAIGSMVIIKKDFGEVTIGDFIISITLLGIGGLISFIVLFANSDWSKRKLF